MFDFIEVIIETISHTKLILYTKTILNIKVDIMYMPNICTKIDLI